MHFLSAVLQLVFELTSILGVDLVVNILSWFAVILSILGFAITLKAFLRALERYFQGVEPFLALVSAITDIIQLAHQSKVLQDAIIGTSVSLTFVFLDCLVLFVFMPRWEKEIVDGENREAGGGDGVPLENVAVETALVKSTLLLRI